MLVAFQIQAEAEVETPLLAAVDVPVFLLLIAVDVLLQFLDVLWLLAPFFLVLHGQGDRILNPLQ